MRGVRGVRRRVGESLAAFGDVARNADLRRLALAFTGSEIGAWIGTIALSVFAYRAGGAGAVGLVLALRTIVPALAAPFTAVLADRYSRKIVMLTADLVRAVLLAAMAFSASSEAPAAVIYGLVTLVSVASTAFRPAQAAILPALTRTPNELTAANVASSTIESVSAFAGPAIGGILLAATSATVCFGAGSALFVWSALLITAIDRPQRSLAEERAEASAGGGKFGFFREAAAGATTVVRDPTLRLLVGLMGAQVLVSGALFVLVVSVAFEYLELGEDGLGTLVGALGVGGVLGAVISLGIVGRRLSTIFSLGIVLWGAPIALIALWQETSGALVLLALIGIGNTLVDVSGLTLLQRAVPDAVLARVFGFLESVFYGTTALGALAAPVLIDWLGIEGALVATGLFLPLCAALGWQRIRAIDAEAVAPAGERALLEQIAIFAPLPPATLESLARRLARERVSAGTPIVRQGETGERFYIVAGGEANVSVDGQPGQRLGPGDHFGEIALLRELPRTATVTAHTDVALYTLARDHFISAVTGHPASAEAADTVIATRLAPLRPAVGPL